MQIRTRFPKVEPRQPLSGFPHLSLLLFAFILHNSSLILAETIVSASSSTNNATIAIGANSVQVLPAAISPHNRVAVTIVPTVACHFRWGATATTSNMLLQAGQSYSENWPVIDNRSLNVVTDQPTNGLLYLEEKLQ